MAQSPVAASSPAHNALSFPKFLENAIPIIPSYLSTISEISPQALFREPSSTSIISKSL